MNSVPPRGDVGRAWNYGRSMRFTLAVAALLAAAGVSNANAPAAGRRPCIVPRLYALRVAPARVLLASSGCTLGGLSNETNVATVPRVTDQVPAPGAILPPSARVFLIVS